MGAPSGYGRADRLLHRIALGSRAVMETSFDLEWAAHGKAARAAAAGERPVFVCGLARGGTSLAARLIAGAPGFAAPAYRDMPFPLAPNLWARLAGRRRRVVAAERGHGDGLAHDLDTPEAIEEVFWRCFEGARYLRAGGLAPAPPGAATLDALRRYMALVVLRGGGGRYVSKNNNNVLRVSALAGAFPDALFVHPFRRPADQAASLERQHARAIALQREDPFRRHYADWLGHHEFGMGRRPFLLPGGPGAGETAEGEAWWLAQWSAVYGHLLAHPEAVRRRQIFLDLDALRAAPDAGAARLAAFVGAEAMDAGAVRPGEAGVATAEGAGETADLYQRLLAAAAEGDAG